MKKIISILLIIVILCGLGVYCYYDAFHFAPNRIKVRNEKIESTVIPSSLDNFQILYFSDLHYNAFMDQERFIKIVDKINAYSPDVVIFAGDLFDHPSNAVPSEAIQSELTELLSNIEAPMGKFAVWGNHDLESPSTKEMIQLIYDQSGFEVLENASVRLHNKTNEYINLIGLDSALLGNIDMNKAFADITNSTFNLTVCHTPDAVDSLPYGVTNLMFSGHSHGGQIYLPIIGPLYKAPQAEKYHRGTYNINTTLLDITNGVGTTRMDARFLADPEIVIYRLVSISAE